MNAKLDRKKFRQFLHENFNISDDVIMDRIFKYFNKNSTDDIDHEEWVVGFNIFLKGSKGCNFLAPSGAHCVTHNVILSVCM